MSKRVLISGYYGFENFGDDLILDVLVQQLKAFGASPIVLSENPEQTSQRYGVRSIQRTEVFQIWRAMTHVDAFISGGGGLFQDVTGPGSPIYYGGLIEMAHWKKRPVSFFGQGVGPLRSLLGLWLTKRAIGHAELVVVRDAKSQVIIQQLTDRKPEIMADPVWLWQPGNEMIGVPRKGIGVSLRPWPALQQSDIEHLASCLAQLPIVREEGVNIIDCHAGVDIVPLAKLEQCLKEQNVSFRWFSEGQCVRGIAQSKALIGMRYHAVLVASQFGVPVVALSYDPKVQILATQLQIADFPVANLKALSVDSLQDALLRLPNAEVMDTFRRDAMLGFQHLKHWLGV